MPTGVSEKNGKLVETPLEEARDPVACKMQETIKSHGKDAEAMSCYNDIDHADVFTTWGDNMTEMHPVLFSRMLANKSDIVSRGFYVGIF